MVVSLLAIFGITLVVFLGVVAAMAVGVILGRQEIKGSCGGLANGAPDGEEGSSCALCSNPDQACRELREKMNGASTAQQSPSFDSNPPE